MLDQFFCVRVAVFSLVGYCMAIGGPIYLDPKLSTHVGHGARSHPHGWIWWLFAPGALLLPYFGVQFFTSKEALVVISVLPLLLLAIAAALSFPPERPHSVVLLCTLGFASTIILTVVCRVSMSDFAYVANTAIPFESRLEQVKAVVTFWQMISVYGAAGYLAFAVTWVYAMWFTTEKRVTSAEDRLILGQAQLAFAIVVSICVVLGPLYEAFSNSFSAMSQLSNVK